MVYRMKRYMDFVVFQSLSTWYHLVLLVLNLNHIHTYIKSICKAHEIQKSHYMPQYQL